jgi:hypothetical protein
MTQSEFNHLLGSIGALSREQMRQLRGELDSRLAAAPGEPPLTEAERADQELQRRLSEAGFDWDGGVPADPDPRRAALGNHHP